MKVGTAISVTKTVSMLRSIRCEACGADYVYLQKVSGKGFGTTLFDIDYDDISERASRDSERQLIAEIEKIRQTGKHSPTACPSCGIYQQNMISAAAHDRGCMKVWIGIWMFLGGVAVAISLCFYKIAYPTSSGPVLDTLAFVLPLVIMGGPLSTPFLYLIFRFLDVNTSALREYRISNRDNDARLLYEFNDLMTNIPYSGRGPYQRFIDYQRFE